MGLLDGHVAFLWRARNHPQILGKRRKYAPSSEATRDLRRLCAACLTPPDADCGCARPAARRFAPAGRFLRIGVALPDGRRRARHGKDRERAFRFARGRNGRRRHACVLPAAQPRAGNVSLSARLTQDRAVEIRTADTAIGMKPDEIQLVLEPFRQIENTFNCQYNGTGLGLPLTGLRAATTGVGAPACRSRGPTAPLAKSSAAA